MKQTKTLTIGLHLHREQVKKASCKESQPGQKDLQATSREETTAEHQMSPQTQAWVPATPTLRE